MRNIVCIAFYAYYNVHNKGIIFFKKNAVPVIFLADDTGDRGKPGDSRLP